MTARSIERAVADAILQQPSGTVTLRGVDYPLGPPSPATLIMLSGLCGDLPVMDVKGNILHEVLLRGRDCGVLGRMVAVLILGAKRVCEGRMVEVEAVRERRGFLRRLLGLPCRMVTARRLVPELDYLSGVVLEDLSPSGLSSLTEQLLLYGEVADFFALTTSLCGANLLRPSGEVVTASGAV